MSLFFRWVMGWPSGRHILILIFVSISLLELPSLQAQVDGNASSLLSSPPPALEARLRPTPDGKVTLGYFGSSVALDGARALVGGVGLADGGGAVYVMEQTDGGWQEVALLQGSDVSFDERFGSAVSLQGNRAIVGAERATGMADEAGAVYVFEYDGSSWQETAKLVADDGSRRDQFGFALGLSGDQIVVGARGNAELGVNAGAAYVFEQVGGTWRQSAKLVASDGVEWDQFGHVVDIYDERILVGGEYQGNDDEAAKVYVFEHDGQEWSESAHLTAKGATDFDLFGLSLSLDQDRALIGAFRDEVDGVRTGAAYVFDFDGQGWVQTARLLADETEPVLGFGFSVSLDGDRAVVMNPFEERGGSNPPAYGLAYVFEFDGSIWRPTEKIRPSADMRMASFARAVDLNGDQILFGVAARPTLPPNIPFPFGFAFVVEQSDGEWGELTRLVVQESASVDRFGSGISMEGDRALIGAPGINDLFIAEAAAYIYQAQGTRWVESAVLRPGDDENLDQFGQTVLLNGDRAFVFAESDFTNGEFKAGLVFVFEDTGPGWELTHRLEASDAARREFFGRALSAQGQILIVGAPAEATEDSPGAVYVFEYNGIDWEERSKLLASDGEAGDRFGAAIDLSGQRLVIGAPGDDDSGPDAGAVYVFEFDGMAWSEVVKLNPADLPDNEAFGFSLSLDNDRLAVGSGLARMGSGSAYLFDLKGNLWEETARLASSDPQAQNYFGASISLSGDRLLVGARDSGNSNSVEALGEAFLFTLQDGSWVETARIRPDPRLPGDEFGGAVELSGDRLMISERGNDDHGSSAGRVSIFALDWQRFNDRFEQP